MTNISNYSAAYQHFLNFFNLTGRERLEGLDKSYFEEMTNEERDLAFLHLKSEPHFECYQENLRGLYLCNPEKAILLFKNLLKKTPEKYPTQHGNDMVIGGRVFMSGYVCNTETTKENINNLVSIDVSNSNDDVRNLKYQLIPISPTTPEAIACLKNALNDELKKTDSDSPLSTAKITLMSIYGVEFSLSDENYKKIYRALSSTNSSEKLAAIKKLESIQNPVLAV